MKETSTNPLLPIVTMEEILAYRSNKPETHTKSRFVNAVCEAFERLGYSPRAPLADYLQIDIKDLRSALMLDCNRTLTEIRQSFVHQKVETIKAENPGWNSDQLARHLGFADRSALFRLLGVKTYVKKIAKFHHWQ